MQVIKDNKTLAAAIAQLKNEKKCEGILLRKHFEFTVHNLNPINMFKEKINQAVNSPDLKGKILSTALAIGSSYFTNTLIMGSSASPLKKYIASFVQSKVASLSTANTEEVKEKGISFLTNTLQKLKIK